MTPPSEWRLVLGGQRAWGLALLIVVFGLGVALSSARAHADSIEVTNLAERAPDPASVTFTARVRAPAGVKSARLVYKVSQRWRRAPRATLPSP